MSLSVVKQNKFIYVTDLAIVNHPHPDGDVPHATSYVVYISRLIRFAIFVIELSQKNFVNRVSDFINFGKRFRNSIKEIFPLLANIIVT